MGNKATCSLCSVYEHDMDVLIMQAMLSDSGFLKLFLSKTDLSASDLTPVHAEISNTDTDLGETDITVILSSGTDIYALLIEDKIDAVAQPEQHERYIKRGEKAVAEGLYTDYRVFIVCPQKYYELDAEAKKYEHFVSYEECVEHFSRGTDVMSHLRYQEVVQALTKAKTPPQVRFNDDANGFFRQYRAYQREHYPMLEMRTKETSNGYWVDYQTIFPYKDVILYHKMKEGNIDLTFCKDVKKYPELDSISSWLNYNGFMETCALITGKSVAIRMKVPAMNYQDGWENMPSENLDKCFTALCKMTRLARLFYDVQQFMSEEENSKEAIGCV